MKQETKGRVVSALIPGDFLLLSRLGDWYRRNPHHRFKEGDILILKNRRIFGYGFRPVAVVKGFEVKDFGFGNEGRYNIMMYTDSDFVKEFDEEGRVIGDRWVTQNEVPKDIERVISENECHFKWNIENQFKKVSVRDVGEALALYRSKEVGQNQAA